MEHLRRNLLEQIDSLRVEYTELDRILRTLPEEVLYKDAGSNWQSIFGILAHSVVTQDVTLSWLGGDPRGLHTELAGKVEGLDALCAHTLASTDALFQAVEKEANLDRIIEYWFPNEGDWYRHRFSQLIQDNILHVVAHRAHTYMIAREHGFELTQNAIFYYYRHPPLGAVCLDDKEIYPDPKLGARFFPDGDAGEAAAAFLSSIDIVQRAEPLLALFSAACTAREDSAETAWTPPLVERLTRASERMKARIAEAKEGPQSERNTRIHVGLEEVRERLEGIKSYLGMEASAQAKKMEADDVEIRRFDSPNLRREFASRVQWRARGVPKEVENEALEYVRELRSALESWSPVGSERE